MPRQNVGFDLDFAIIDWNIGGAKYLELPSNKDWKPTRSSSSKKESLAAEKNTNSVWRRH